MNKKDLWQSALTELQLNLSRPTYSSWFANTKILNIKKVSSDRQIIEVAVLNLFAKNTIEERYLGQVKEILDSLTKLKNELKITVKPEVLNLKKIKKTEAPLLSLDYEKENQKLLKKTIQSAGLRPDFTFKTFAVSSTNEVAYAAARAVSKNPNNSYHLLFLYGGVGVGKTHLMQAIGHQILEKNPKTLIVYSSAEEFTNEIINAIRTKSTSSFRQKYRSAKLLLIDDVQFIGGKNTVQEEFFHTFNTIHRAGGHIVLTSDKLPDQIVGLEDRLRSRFEGGLTIDIQKPNFELRTAILLIKSRQWGKTIPMDVAQLIASNIESTRKLEGFLIRLITESETIKKPITPELAQKLLGRVSEKKTKTKKNIKPKEILDAVCSYFDIKISQIKGPKRNKEVVFPRQVAMYLLKTELNIPLIRLGEIFGNRDHTTVMHSVKKIDKNSVISESLRLDIEALKKRIYGEF
jgi:chromosomal replication initiator protein